LTATVCLLDFKVLKQHLKIVSKYIRPQIIIEIRFQQKDKFHPNILRCIYFLNDKLSDGTGWFFSKNQGVGIEKACRGIPGMKVQ
jgi:hypothetical protein